MHGGFATMVAKKMVKDGTQNRKGWKGPCDAC